MEDKSIMKFQKLMESIKLTANIASSQDLGKDVKDKAGSVTIELLKKLQSHIETENTSLKIV